MSDTQVGKIVFGQPSGRLSSEEPNLANGPKSIVVSNAYDPRKELVVAAAVSLIEHLRTQTKHAFPAVCKNLAAAVDNLQKGGNHE